MIEKRGGIDPTPHFYNFAAQKNRLKNIEVGSRHYELIDLNDEDAEEIPQEFDPDIEFSHPHTIDHPPKREFGFDEQIDANEILCKSFLKRVLKGAEKVGKKVKKGGKKIEQTKGTSSGGTISKSSTIGSLPHTDVQKIMPQGPSKSCHFQTDGMKFKGLGIGFINGMKTSCVEHWSHLNHLKKHAGELSIQGVYNHSNSTVVDLLEIFALNYGGIAPITANLLLENWTQFHEENKDNPRAKYLQFTHSMGTIQTKTALERAPQEIRDRVIVVAIGPAVIIPENLCFDSYHYASKKDGVHLGENIVTLGAVGSLNQAWQREAFEQLIENKKQLIILEPHPDATGMDHDFESPTFEKVIKGHMEDYFTNKGQY